MDRIKMNGQMCPKMSESGMAVGVKVGSVFCLEYCRYHLGHGNVANEVYCNRDKQKKEE